MQYFTVLVTQVVTWAMGTGQEEVEGPSALACTGSVTALVNGIQLSFQVFKFEHSTHLNENQWALICNVIHLPSRMD